MMNKRSDFAINCAEDIEDIDVFVEEEMIGPDIPAEKRRTRGMRRKKDIAKAMRKRAIDRTRHSMYWQPWYSNLHQYSKNKIHCSCPLCRFHGPSASDMRKTAAAEYSMCEALEF